MDMDEVQTQACRKVSRSGNGISGHQTEELNGTVSGNAEVGDSGINRLRGWNPSSRIIRVSRASGGKDRHSKVWTSKGLRDRRVRLSVSTAIQFYDLQDRLGYDQPSKAVEWLIKSAADSIAELPSINTSFPDNHYQLSDEKLGCNGGHNHQNEGFSLSKSTCSSTSDTSKNSSGLSLSRSEIRGNNRVKARERARERATKEKERDNNNRNVEPQNSSSFTQLLTGSFGDGSDNSPAGYFSHQGYNGQFQPGTSFPHHQGMSSVPPFSISGDQNHHHQEPLHKFSFVPESLIQSAGSAGGDYGTLNFSISSSSSSGGGLSGYNRGTLQSNSPSLFTTNLQRFSSSSSTNVDGSNLPFFIGSTASPFENHHNNHNNHHQHHEFLAGSDGSLQLYYNGDGNRCSSDHKDKGKK